MKTEISIHEHIDDLISRAFREDVGTGDITTEATIDAEAAAEAVWISKQEGVVAGLAIAGEVFRRLDPRIEWDPQVDDGDQVAGGTRLVRMQGNARAILTAERLALNIAQRMSGIATKTNRFVKAVKGLDTKILDTRKTAPGLRVLDKYAVEAGGGTNHRMGLYDLAMIKDNHITAAGGITRAVQKVRGQFPEADIEVETANLQQVGEALAAQADIIMLDNMPASQMKEAVSHIGGRIKTEASGNITVDNVRDVAETGVDYISVGALTHSVRAFDISQKLEKLI